MACTWHAPCAPTPAAGIFIADALSMPVHWYYNPNDIVRDFGGITDYRAPKARHPSSIMSVSNTGGHGRGGQAGRIIGEPNCERRGAAVGVPCAGGTGRTGAYR